MSEVRGVPELLAKLQRLEKKDAAASLRKGTRAAAKVVLKAAKSNAPVLTGALKGMLKVRAKKRKRNQVGHLVDLQIPEGAKTFYPGFQEYGLNRTRHMAAKHYLKQAFESEKDSAANKAIEIATAEIQRRMKL